MLNSYEQMSATGDLGFSSTTASNLASLYIDMRRFDDAERYAQIALQTSSPDDVEPQGAGRKVMAGVLANRGDLEAAKRLAHEAVAIAEATDYLTLRGDALDQLAEVLLAGRTGFRGPRGLATRRSKTSTPRARRSRPIRRGGAWLKSRDRPVSRLPRLALARVGVEAAPGLLAQVAGRDELAQDRGRREARVAEALVQHFHDVQADVEADEVGQLERAHGVVEADAGRRCRCPPRVPRPSS